MNLDLGGLNLDICVFILKFYFWLIKGLGVDIGGVEYKLINIWWCVKI